MTICTTENERFPLPRRIVIWIIALAVGSLPSAAHAQTMSRCLAAKTKCLSQRIQSDLKCHALAETKGADVLTDPDVIACLHKGRDKFDGGTIASRGCFARAEAKHDASSSEKSCTSFGDRIVADAMTQSLVLDSVSAVDPLYPNPTTNKCAAGKNKCVHKHATSLLKCYQSAQQAGLGRFSEGVTMCVNKARAKFDGGPTPSKGCFARLEAKQNLADPKTVCPVVGNAGALEARVENAVIDTMALVDPDFRCAMPPAVRSWDVGSNVSASFGYPTAIAADGAGNVYVLESFTYTPEGYPAIRKYTPRGDLLATFDLGSLIGEATCGGQDAGDLTVDSVGNMYVISTSPDAIGVLHFAPDGTFVRTLGSHGGNPCLAFCALSQTDDDPCLSSVRKVTVDSQDNLYVLHGVYKDNGNDLVHRVSKFSPDGLFLGAPVGGFHMNPDGPYPYENGLDLSVDASGAIYVLDHDHFGGGFPYDDDYPLIGRKYSASGQLLGPLMDPTSLPPPFNGFFQPTHMAVDAGGFIWFADLEYLAKLSATGVLSSVSSEIGGPHSNDEQIIDVSVHGGSRVLVLDDVNHGAKRIRDLECHGGMLP